MTEQLPTSVPEESLAPSAAAQPLEEPALSSHPTASMESTGSEPAIGEPTWTGVPAVDEVLRGMDELDQLPLEEHLGQFEHAHETLRSALDGDPIEPGDPA